jgi:hypothetical protein
MLVNIMKYQGGASDGYAMAISETDISLPVVLATFTATLENGKVQLYWMTASEVNNLGFHVYRAFSCDGPWQRLSMQFIPGAGNSSYSHSYHFIDPNVYGGFTYWYRLEDIDLRGIATLHVPISISLPNLLIPRHFTLQQNYPNPFNPATRINYELHRESKVTITVIDLSGHPVARLLDEMKAAGYHDLLWDARELPSGTYFIHIQADNFNDVKKCILLK